MGLFDTVEVDESIELPGLESNRGDIWWQTKSFTPFLGLYRVTVDGKLLEEEYTMEEVPEEERPYYDEDLGGFESSLQEWAGSMRKVRTGWTQKNFHGVMRMVGSDDDYFYEYSLKFTDGILEDVELVEKRESIQ